MLACVKKTSNFLNRNFKKQKSPDFLSSEERSKRMAKIRSKGTKFEKQFIALLKKATDIKFQTFVQDIRGKPDIVFKNQKICVFLDSDFWHGWQYPRWKHLLKNDFWRKKIDNNRKRDRRISSFLKRKGWKVLRFWEHQIIHDPKKKLKTILNALSVNN